MAEVHVLAISGSLRRGSLNSAALRAAQQLAPDGMAIEIMTLHDLPLYDDDLCRGGVPSGVAGLGHRIAAADAVLISTPEYNYSVPGVLKNAIDWISRVEPQPFVGKPVAIMGVSPSMIGTARAQYDLRKIFVYLDALVLNKPEIMIGNAAARFDAAGNLIDEKTREFIASQLLALAAWARKVRVPPTEPIA